MNEFSISPSEKARKAISAVLQVLKINGKQGQVAVSMGLSDSTMSRLVNDHMDGVVVALYHAGFKVVPQSMACYPAEQVEAWFSAYKAAMNHAETAAKLFEGME